MDHPHCLSLYCSFQASCVHPELGLDRILKPGYTQLLLVIQSSVNLGAAVEGFCRFSYVARSDDLEKGRLSWVSLA